MAFCQGVGLVLIGLLQIKVGRVGLKSERLSFKALVTLRALVVLLAQCLEEFALWLVVCGQGSGSISIRAGGALSPGRFEVVRTLVRASPPSPVFTIVIRVLCVRVVLTISVHLMIFLYLSVVKN